MRIGEVAKKAGVSVDTVRYYERDGLLHRAPRTASGYRAFPPEAVERILFVKQAQALGFKLEEVAEILAAIDRGGVNYRRGAKRLERLLARLDEQLASLRALRGRVVEMRDAMRTGHCDDMESTIGRLRAGRRR